MSTLFKKILCTALSAAMIAGILVMPVTASAASAPLVNGDTVLKEWKFDFGAKGSAPEAGYTLVTPEMSFTSNSTAEGKYGFFGH